MSGRSIRALVINPDYSSAVVELSGGDTSMLAALQQTVGGYIEAVTGDTWVMYCNEEGKLMSLPVNALATVLMNRLMRGFSQHDVLVGTVVFLGNDGSGQEADVSDELLAAWREVTE